MKILKVTLENLASYDGLYTIDFTREPLKDAGLYSIVGSTGSGKSTILDAICLALYGRAPRFEDATDLKYFDNKEQHTKERSKILLPGDTRNILRKGAREGRAEVEFIANDGERYRAIWYVKHGTKQYAPRERTLLKYSKNDDGTETEELLFKRNADSKLFQQVIGLDYDQFTRTIMLAQNSFANFIKCDGKEKAKLLERLTGTEIYTQIAIRINVHYKEAQSQLNEFNIRMDADRRDLLSDEERDDCTRQLNETQGLIKKLECDSKSIDRQTDWLHRRDNANIALQKDKDTLSTKRQEWNSHTDEEKALAIYSKLVQISPTYGNLIQTESDIRTGEQELITITADTKNAILLQEASEKHFNECTEQRKAAQKAYEDLQPLLKEARRIQSVISIKGKDIHERKLNYENLQQKTQTIKQEVENNKKTQINLLATLKKAEDTLHSLQPFEAPIQQTSILLRSLASLKDINVKINVNELQAKNIRTEVQQLTKTENILKAREISQRKNYDGICDQLRKQEDMLKDIDGSIIRKAMSDSKDRANAFEKAAQYWVEYFREEQKVIKLHQDVEEYEKRIIQLKRTEAELTQQRQEQEKQLPGLQTAYQLLVGESVEKMRAILKENEPCPVCGSIYHPYAEAHTVDAAVLTLRNKLEYLQKSKNETEKQLSKLHDESSTENGTLANKRDELRTAIESLPDKESNWEAYTYLDPLLTEDIAAEDRQRARQRYDFLKEQQAKFTALYAENLKKEENFSKQESIYQQTQKQKDEQLQLLQQTERSCNDIRLRLVRKEQEVSGLENTLKEDKQIESNITNELDGYGLEKNWKELWSKDATLYAATWNERTQIWQQATKDKEQITSDLKSLKATYEALCRQVKETESILKTAQTAYLEGKKELQTLEEDLNTFWNGKRPEEIEREADCHLQELQKSCEELSNRSNEAKVAVEKLQAVKKGKREHQTQLQRQKETLMETITSWMKRSNIDIPLERLKWYLAKERNWENIRTLLTKKKEELKELEGRIKAGQQLVDEIEKSENCTDLKEDELQTRQQSLRTTLEQEKRIQQELLIKLENDNKSHKRLKESIQEQEKLNKTFNDWNELNKLMGANQGDDIRQAAQCYTLQFLVAHANRQLKMLTSRYRLVHVPDSLSLRIKDMDYAGEERNISSLSGGETFLISLALALGLSAISSGNHNYSMLFIDEGFGTLDQESLNTVIDALSSLQSIQGKKVGVISHTAEMRERIPVQIQVIKGNAEGKSSLRIV